MLEYDKKNIPRARQLRKNMTPWEKKLWYQFLREYVVRFQRQKAIDRFIVDFYCAKARLVIELDGSGHYEPEAEKQDRERTGILESYGLQILRIPNNAVDQNFEGVCEYIDLTVKSRMQQKSSL